MIEEQAAEMDDRGQQAHHILFREADIEHVGETLLEIPGKESHLKPKPSRSLHEAQDIDMSVFVSLAVGGTWKWTTVRRT